MAIVHYTAKAKDSRTLELPEEAQALGLQNGDDVYIFVTHEGPALTEVYQDEEQQERFRALTAQLFVETDAVERQPGTYMDPQKARVAAMIAEKHNKIGMDV